MRSDSGFSLVEVLVSTAILLIVVAMVATAFVQTRKISSRNQMDVEIIERARIGIDKLARSLRMIGFRRDTEHTQAAFIEAAPFQIIFNADVDPNEDALTPEAIINLYDATEYVAPFQTYTTGAETIRWTIDSTTDGIVDGNDTNDNPAERNSSQNPNDMLLVKEINGERTNTVMLGILGPYDVNDDPTGIVPMFQYWVLEPDNTYSLLGDLNDDQRLDGEERYFQAVHSQEILNRIRRIQITITTESDGNDPMDQGKHRKMTLSTEVSLRNIE